MKKKKSWGGKRKGAGRKESDTKTTTLSFRVPAEKAESLKEKIKSVISQS